MTLKCLDSDVAQWKRVWLITRRSVDRNHSLLPSGGPLAQSAERGPNKAKVSGSIPLRTNFKLFYHDKVYDEFQTSH